MIRLAGRPPRFGFTPSVPPSSGVPPVVLLLSTRPAGVTSKVEYWLRLMPWELAGAMFTAGMPVDVCVIVGLKAIGARGSTIGAACAALSKINAIGLRYVTTAITHAVIRIHHARRGSVLRAPLRKRRVS